MSRIFHWKSSVNESSYFKDDYGIDSGRNGLRAI